MTLKLIFGGIRLRILLAGISDLLSVDIPLGTIFSYQTAVDHVEVRDGIESDFFKLRISIEKEDVVGKVSHIMN